MACILKDNYKYAPGEPMPEIPREPMCCPYYPPEVSEFAEKAGIINIIILGILYGIVLPCTAACFLPLGNHQEFEWPGVIFFTVGTVIIILIERLLNKISKNSINKRIYDPNLKIKKMRSIVTQNMILNDNDPHFIKHLEYYRMTGSWIMPE